MLTTPQEAKQFVDATKIDVLAPAVGNMHGLLKSMIQGKSEKRLNIQRIAEIKAAAGIFMTLHGGSGTHDQDFQQAIRAGMTIVHVNTELRLAWRRSLEKVLQVHPDEVAPYKLWALFMSFVSNASAKRCASICISFTLILLSSWLVRHPSSASVKSVVRRREAIRQATTNGLNCRARNDESRTDNGCAGWLAGES